MKLVIFEGKKSYNFFPIAYLRPTFELRCGHSLLYEKILRNHPGTTASFFCRDYLEETFSQRAPGGSTVNDMASLDDDLLILNGNLLLLNNFSLDAKGPEEAAVTSDGELLYARVGRETAGSVRAEDIYSFLEAVAEKLPTKEVSELRLINYQWELIHHNGAAIEADFRAAGKSGVEGKVHETATVYGPTEKLYVAPGAVVHPQVVIDTNHGPVTIEQGAEVFPHSRIEGPCYIGPETQITRGNIREGCSFGPVCRVGGEVEESIIHQYSNKYHDGFLGHAYVCEWVNLGALTTNSDLKNDYGTVEVYMQDSQGNWGYVDTADTKVGSFIGDHTKTSIGTFLNTGGNVGVMTLLMGTGSVLPKFIPSFAWYLEGAVTGGFGYAKLMETAEKATARRNKPLTAADKALLDHVYELTKPERSKAIKKDRRKLLRR
ncbi:MAG: putative sugar nucleotidyl transferase [Gemmatimonadota bacterium]|nr:putative sugar nucleotidyl transferase [Gemmatimonadota bacterium]